MIKVRHVENLRKDKHMRTFILAFLLSGCSFISNSEHSRRVAEAQVLAGQDADGTGPVDDTGSTGTDSDQDADDTGSAPPDTDDTGSAPPDTDDTGTPPTDIDGGPPTDIDEDGDGFSEIDGDCVDTDPTVYPGAAERCDSIDNDCDGEVDEDIIDTWYRDGDGDHWGDESIPVSSCSPGDGWAAEYGDCDDTDGAIHPGAEEVCDFVDNNCNDATDEGVEPATFFEDSDGDEHGNDLISLESCLLPDGYASIGDDCDDTDGAIHPDAEEVCDFVDNNCDGETDEGVTPEVYYLDEDGDEHGNPDISMESCVLPEGYASVGDDCDDSTVAIHPEAMEVCNGIDDDCDTLIDDDDGSTHTDTMSTFYDDLDHDLYGDPATASLSCEPLSGAVGDGTDCDDEDDSIHPGADEYCNFVDDDCNDLVDDDGVDAHPWYEDADDDGYGNPVVVISECTMPFGYVDDNTDCDDTALTTYPGAPEIGYDETDNDCNDLVDDMNITDEALWSVTGTSSAPELGSEGITSAGDVNGNGIDDLLISAPLHDASGRANCGAIAFHEASLGSVPYTDAYLLVEGTLNAKSGRSIVLGNIDGDDAPEIAHAGFGAQGGGVRRGVVWIYDVDGLTGTQRAEAIYQGRIRGHHTDDAVGTDFAAGDFSGDGLTEIVVGAPQNGVDEPGEACIFEDGDGFKNDTVHHGDATLCIDGENDGDRMGAVIENVGDITGDGVDALVVCAPNALSTWGSPRGTCWLYSYPVAWADSDSDVDASEIAIATFIPNFTSDEFGKYVDTVTGGDFVGTSPNEIAFGLPGANTVVVYESTTWSGTFEPADAAVTVTGPSGLGRSLSGSIDFDADGAVDLLVSAPTAHLGTLFFLPQDSLFGDLVVPGAEGASWRGFEPSDGAGFAFSGLGDFNEDGASEFAIAAPHHDTEDTDAGQVWILPAY
jgi:hypothetical protein